VLARGRGALATLIGGGSRGCKTKLAWTDWSHIMTSLVVTPAGDGASGRIYLLQMGMKGPGSIERHGGYEVESRAKQILSGLGIHQEDQNRPTESFSGGWKMRIALAKILVLQPDVLLMDEPTNHLDIESIIWLEQWLVNFKGSIMMTSHDREFMNRIVSKIVEVAHQTVTVYSGNYDFYEKEKVIRLEQLLAGDRAVEREPVPARPSNVGGRRRVVRVPVQPLVGHVPVRAALDADRAARRRTEEREDLAPDLDDDVALPWLILPGAGLRQAGRKQHVVGHRRHDNGEVRSNHPVPPYDDLTTGGTTRGEP
jgi:hypothetical protein